MPNSSGPVVDSFPQNAAHGDPFFPGGNYSDNPTFGPIRTIAYRRIHHPLVPPGQSHNFNLPHPGNLTIPPMGPAIPLYTRIIEFQWEPMLSFLVNTQQNHTASASCNGVVQPVNASVNLTAEMPVPPNVTITQSSFNHIVERTWVEQVSIIPEQDSGLSLELTPVILTATMELTLVSTQLHSAFRRPPIRRTVVAPTATAWKVRTNATNCWGGQCN